MVCFYTDYDGPHHAMVDVRGVDGAHKDGWMFMDELHVCVCVCVWMDPMGVVDVWKGLLWMYLCAWNGIEWIYM